ncbi:MAG: PP2C family protein-serine/threonine phosphatase [Magnetovibrionaceae bacterium]
MKRTGPSWTLVADDPESTRPRRIANLLRQVDPFSKLPCLPSRAPTDTVESDGLICFVAAAPVEGTVSPGSRALTWLSHPAPVIVLADRAANSKQRCSYLASGAADVWSFDLSDEELLARLSRFTERETERRVLASERNRLDRELELTRRMQNALFPSRKEEQMLGEAMGLTIRSEVRASSELGGDIWGMRALGRNRLALFIADFAGHGMGAAVNTFRLQAIMASLGSEPDRPVAVIDEVNRTLVELLPREHYATFFYGVLDVPNRHLHYAAAGCPPPFLVRGTGMEPRALETAGLPVGISAKARYDHRQADLGKARALFLYSDIWIEGFANGPEHLAKKLMKIRRADAFVQLMRDFDEEQPATLTDDLTAVWIDL